MMEARVSQIAYAYILGVSVLCCMTGVRASPIPLVELLQVFGLAAIVLTLIAFRPVKRFNEKATFLGGFVVIGAVGLLLGLLWARFPGMGHAVVGVVDPYMSYMFSMDHLFRVLVILINLLFFVWCFLRSSCYLRAAVFGFLAGGLLSTLFALISYLSLTFGGPDLPGAYQVGEVVRARGFFSEGGPFGLYAVTQIGIAAVAFHLGWIERKRVTILICFFGAGLYLSASASGFFTLLLIVSIVIASHSWAWHRKVTAFIVLSLAVTVFATNLIAPVFMGNGEPHIAGTEPTSRPDVGVRYYDPVFVTPSTETENWAVNIGFGQRALAHRAFESNGYVSSFSKWDLVGIGLLTLVAELPIPLTIAGICGLLLSHRSVLTRRRNRDLVLLGLFAGLTLSIGMIQINFSYLWIVFAMAAAVMFGHRTILTGETEVGQTPV